jgi:hypothetical protein
VARPTTPAGEAPAAPAAAAAPAARLNVPEVLRLLDGDGCVLCRSREQAAATWIRWFVIESHGDVATVTSLLDSGGFCPAHTRRLLGLDSAQLFRMPWEFVLRGALERAERLSAGSAASPLTAPCPLCRTCGDREDAAAGELVGSLQLRHVAAALRTGGRLCYPHLRRLLPRMQAPQLAVSAEAVAANLGELAPESSGACLRLAGLDPDAPARAPLLQVHAARLAQGAGGGDRHGDPVGLPPRDRLVADLMAGSCPLCRAAGREETRYLLWLHERWPKRGPASLETHLCPRHLHDMWATGESAGWLTGIRVGASRQLTAQLAATAADPAAATATRRPLRSRVGPPRMLSRRAGLPEAYRVAYEAVRGDSYCRACRVGRAAARRQRDLIRACLHDTRVLEAVGDAHGVCLRHAADGSADIADTSWRPLLVRLLTQLRQAQWELSEDAEKQAWDYRYEPKGSERSAWRRIPALIDGAVYLGLAEQETVALPPAVSA